MMTAMSQAPAYTELACFKSAHLRLQRRVLWLREWWADSEQAPLQGLAISDSDVDRFLENPTESAAREAEFYASDPVASKLTGQIEEWERAPDPKWHKLVSTCGLTAEEAGLLALALAVEAQPWLRRVCGYLHDDATAQYATPWLAACLMNDEGPWRFTSSSALIRWRLATPIEAAASRWSGIAGWQADPELLTFLLDDSGCSARHYPDNPCIYPGELERITIFARKMGQGGSLVEIEIAGPNGSGRQTLAGQLAANLGVELQVADAAGPADVDRMIRALRRAALSGALLCWRNADALDRAVWSQIRGMAPLVVYCTSNRMEWAPVSSVATNSVRLPELRSKDRTDLWYRFTGELAPSIILESRLLPAELRMAADVSHRDLPTLARTCASVVFRSQGDLFTELPLPYTWDDLVVNKQLRDQLRELEAHARHRYAVLEGWEFRRLTPMGQGLTALFAGPSGTGKTMAAQVIARSLGMTLLRVDLSSVVNMYIGETEKRLKMVFDSCERSPAILFFDEADALFGQRTQVKVAHDRFANIEINYLLQRMEQFNGVAILATNRKDDLDNAFQRRLRLVVDFPMPAPDERREIWVRCLPATTSLGIELLEGTIDYNLLSTRLELTGAAIKSAVLGAAFLAKDEGSRIAMRHIVAAARREMLKLGRVLRSGDIQA